MKTCPCCKTDSLGDKESDTGVCTCDECNCVVGDGTADMAPIEYSCPECGSKEIESHEIENDMARCTACSAVF